MANASDLTEWLADNPKMMGALWTTVLLLSQVGPALATGGGADVGP